MKNNKPIQTINTYLAAKDPDTKGIMEKVKIRRRKKEEKESAPGDTPITFAGEIPEIIGRV